MPVYSYKSKPTTGLRPSSVFLGFSTLELLMKLTRPI